MITLHQFEISPFCDKVRRILNVKAAPYRIREVSLQQAVTHVTKVNPAGKLPAIEHDGRAIGDSTDIALYLEERFPDPPLLPADPRERGLVLALEDWADESLYFYEMYLRFTVTRNAARWVPELTAHDSDLVQRAARFVIPRHMKGILAKQGLGRKTLAQVTADVERQMTAIDGMLGDGRWLVGAELSLADIAVFAQLYCIRGVDEGATAAAKRPRLTAWMDRVEAATAPRDTARTAQAV